MLNSFAFLCKKNSSFSFILCYSEKSYTLCNKFSLKIYYLMSSKYLQMISYFLFVSVRSAEFHKFNDAFNDFDSEFAPHDVIC